MKLKRRETKVKQKEKYLNKVLGLLLVVEED